MTEYEKPMITELGSVADFTRGDTFAWRIDGTTLAEIIENAHNGNLLGS
jgi:hypothetical protein